MWESDLAGDTVSDISVVLAQHIFSLFQVLAINNPQWDYYNAAFLKLVTPCPNHAEHFAGREDKHAVAYGKFKTDK